MNINSSSSVSSTLTAGNSNAITGLASGIDTDSVVEEMLSGYKKKIQKQESKKQQAEWKQDQYREIISAMTKFQNKYIDTKYDSTLSTNLANKNFFNQMSSVSSSSAVKVSGSAKASAGNMTIKVSQLATAAKMKGNRVSSETSLKGTDAVTADMMQNFSNHVTFDVTTSSGTDSIQIDLNGASSQQDIVNKISDALGSDVSVSISKGKLTLTTSSGTSVSVNRDQSTAKGLKTIGMSSVSSSTDDGKTTLTGSSSVNAENNMDITLTVDGVSKTFGVEPTVTSDGKVTAKALKDALDTSVKNAFGSNIAVKFVGTDGNEVTFDGDGNASGDFKVEFALAGNWVNEKGEAEEGHTIQITGANSQYLGIDPGASSAFSTSQTLQEYGISDSTIDFTINGINFSYSNDTKISKIISDINKSGAGVKLSYSSLENSFSMEATSTGSGHSIELQDGAGGFLSKIFNGEQSANASATNRSTSLTTTAQVQGIQGTVLDADTAIAADADASLTLQIGGETKTFTLAQREDGYTAAEVGREFNDWLKKEGLDDKLEYDVEKGTLIAKDASVGSFTVGDATSDDGSVLPNGLASALGLNTTSTASFTKEVAADNTTKLSDIKELAGLVASGKVDGDSTLEDLKNGITLQDDNGNAFTLSYQNGGLALTNNSEDNEVSLTMSDYGLQDVFGDSVTLGKKGGLAVVDGQDAEVEINGIKTTRSSNNFTVDGVSFTLNDVTNGEEVKITTTRDTDSIINGIKEFVKDYNELLDTLHGYVDADKTYLDYDPLTSEQEDEMSESQIEKWNKKAQEGLLHRDSTIDSFLNSVRSLMYSKPSSSNFALYQIGVDEIEGYQNYGKLEVDEDALRSAIENDPESIISLFTDSTDGIATSLGTLFDAYVKDSSASPGLLVEEAGISGGYYTQSNLTNDINDITTRISNLKDQYEKRREALWKKMSSMETTISSANSTMSYLSSMFGS